MRFAAALLVAVCAAVVLGIAGAFALGGLSQHLSWMALLGGAAVGTLAFRQMPAETRAVRPIHPVGWFLIGVFAVASLRAFLWLLYIKDNQLHILSPNNLGDLPLHLDFIRYLASGVRFWPESPIISGEPLKYPIGADFFNSLLLDAGLPIERGLVWTALAGSALAATALWRWGRGFALAAFLFGGGLSAFVLLRGTALIEGGPLPDFQADAQWKNLFLAIFVTQRGLLYALPAGLWLLDHWRARYLRGEPGLLPGWAALLLYATLPLFNVHAFLFLSVALAGVFIFARNPAARWDAALFVATAFLPATLCAAMVTGGFSAGGMHWAQGWMQPQTGEKGKIAWFWLENFGLYPLLWFVLAGAAVWRGSRETRAFIYPATLVFIVCCFVSFAPWPWDNTKLMLWSWLAVAPCLWTDLLKPMAVIPRAIVCVVLFFTGAVSLIAGLDGRHDYSIVDLPLVENTARALRDFPPDARFACAPEYYQPLIMLGRKVAMGYPGHLWSHGLTFEGKNADKVAAFETLMQGESGWRDSATKLGVGYIYWGPLEQTHYPQSLKPWEKTLPVVARGDEFVIFALPN